MTRLHCYDKYIGEIKLIEFYESTKKKHFTLDDLNIGHNFHDIQRELYDHLIIKM